MSRTTRTVRCWLELLRAAVGGDPAPRRHHGRPGGRARRPGLEALEDRCVPTTFTVTVGTDSPNGMGSGTSGDLRYCISQANQSRDPNGDTIVFDSSVRSVALTHGTLSISDPSSLSIDGLPDSTTISGNSTFGIFQVNSNTTVSFDSLLITGGKATGIGGGGILNQGTLTLSNCTLDSNVAGGQRNGGGIWNAGTLTLDSCLLADNTSSGSGGGISLFGGTATLSNCTLVNNTTTGGNGGGIDNLLGGTLTLSNCTLDRNVASGSGVGGGIINGGTLTLDSCSLDSNTAGSGGGIDSFQGTLTMTACTLDNNVASQGGGGLASGGTATLDGCTFDGNSAVNSTVFGGFGGGISSSGTLTLSNCAVDDNQAGVGGGISNGGTLTLSNCAVDRNTGSGIDNGLDATLTLIDCTLDSNVVGANPALLANHSGGGILNHNNKVTLIDCTLTNNSASSSINGGGEGGGIYNGGTLTMSGCTLAHNSASFSGTGTFGFGGSGGGILNSVNSTLIMSNCTLVNNSASTSGNGTFGGDGGGIENVGTANLTYCTIDSNRATVSGVGSVGGHGGGIHNSSTLTVLDDIVAGNSASSDPDISGTFTDAGHNLLGTALQGIANGPGDVFSDNPGLAPLGDYGGPTQTMALLPGSLALGAAAAPTSLSSDLDDQSTSMSVANASLLELAPGFSVLLVDAEQMLVTAVNGNVLTVVRGYNGTSASDHAAGAAVNLATDQRGQPRPVADQIDIGAYQSQGSGLVVTTAADPGGLLGLLSLREAVNIANADARGGQSDTIRFDASLNGQTISLSNVLTLSGASSTTVATITIDGGGQITIDGGNATDLFQVFGQTVHAILSGLILSDGRASSGGAVVNGGVLSVINSTFSNNSASSDGGAIHNSGGLKVNSCTFSNNSVTGATGEGGAIFNQGTLTMADSTFTSNSAVLDGGAIEEQGGALTVSSSTISNNSALLCGGISISGPAQTIVVDSIVAGDSGVVSPDISGRFTDLGHNLLGTALQSTGGGPGDVFSDNPGLAPLGDNGGPTQTMALLPGSPALGAGAALSSLASALDASSTTLTWTNPTNADLLGLVPGFTVLQIDGEQVLVTAVNGNVLTVTRGYNGTTAASHAAGAAVNLAADQRGLPRMVAGRIDIGAFESQ